MTSADAPLNLHDLSADFVFDPGFAATMMTRHGHGDPWEMPVSYALPPYAQALGIGVDPADAASAELWFDYSDRVSGRPGFLHGGAMVGLMEMDDPTKPIALAQLKVLLSPAE